MMKKYLNFIMISMVVVAFGITGCYEQEVAAPIAPGGLGSATATFTTDFTGSEVVPGDIITYTITLDKMMSTPITFGVRFDTLVTKADADEHDISFEEVTIPAYSTEATLEIMINNGFPMENKSLRLEVGTFGIAERYRLNSATVNPKLDLIVKNDPTLLTIGFGWDTGEDHDIVTFSNDYGAWGNGGATGANPELDVSIWLADPAGEFYVNLVEWGNGSMNYTFTIGHPDNTIQVITGSYDASDVSGYTVDSWVQWGNPDTYRFLRVVNDGTKFVVTDYNN